MSNQVVWKYPLQIENEQYIALPADCKILRVGVQDNKPVIWVLTHPADLIESVKIYIFATGQIINVEVGEYLGSYEIYGGLEIYHVFKGKEDE